MLDNFESVLESGSQAGRYRPGYDGYGGLLEHFAHSSHQSRLIVTSRELPPELGPLKGQSAQVLVVSGLHGADSRALLQDSDLAGDESAWDELVRRSRATRWR